MCPSTSAWVPSVERRPGDPVDQYDTTPDTFGVPCSEVVSARPAAATPASLTVPWFAVTSSARLVCPPYLLSMSCSACVDCADGSLKPPLLSLPNVPNPRKSATIMTTADTARRVRARRVTNLPYRSSMIIPPALDNVYDVNIARYANSVNIGQDGKRDIDVDSRFVPPR